MIANMQFSVATLFFQFKGAKPPSEPLVNRLGCNVTVWQGQTP